MVIAGNFSAWNRFIHSTSYDTYRITIKNVGLDLEGRVIVKVKYNHTTWLVMSGLGLAWQGMARIKIFMLLFTWQGTAGLGRAWLGMD